jgi:WD40 repeat protein
MLRRNLGQTRCLVGHRIRENADPSSPWERQSENGDPGPIRRGSTVLIGFIAAAAFATFAFIGAAQPAQPKTEPPEKARTDQNGDLLPAGALARMGSLRWRHGTAVSYLAFTPDGKAVLTASQDGIIRLWDRHSGKEIRRFQAPPQKLQPINLRVPLAYGYGGTVAGVAMSQDGKLLATVLGNSAVQLWDVETGKDIGQLKGPPNGVATVHFAPDGKSLATRGLDRATTVLEIETGKQLAQIKDKQPQGAIRFVAGGQVSGSEGLAFSHDGRTIATAEMEFGMQKTTITLKLSDAQTGKEIRQIDASQGGVNSVAFSPDGKMLAYGSGNTIHIRDGEGGKEIRTIENKNPIAGLAFASDSKTLAAKGRDQVIRLYEMDTGKSVHELGQATGPAAGNQVFRLLGFGLPEVRDFAFSHDNKVIGAGSGQTVRFWNVGTGKEHLGAATDRERVHAGHRGPISAVVITPDGKTMVSRGADNVIRRWDAATGKELGQFTEPKGTTGVVFSPDGKTAALANANGSVRLHDLADGKELRQLKGHTNGTAAIAFSPDSKRLASRGNVDNIIRVYDVAPGSELKQINVPAPKAPGGGFGGGFGVAAPVGRGLAFSPDGQTLAAAFNANSPGPVRGGQPQVAGDNMLRLWDVATGKEIRKITLPLQRTVTNLAYSPDGRLLATENADRTFSLWEIASGKERALLGTAAAPAGQPTNAFSVAVAGSGPTLGGPLTPATFAFSPDGELLATRGPGNAVRVWEVAPAKEVGLFKGHDGAIGTIAFAPLGKAIASGSADTTILVWDMARLNREPKGPAVELQAKEVATLWAELIGDDADKASSSIRKLASAPKQTTPFLAERVKPAAPPDVKKIAQWIADLDSDNFKTRAIAAQELEKLGELAIPALEKVLVSQSPVEMIRRAQGILEKLTTGALTAEQIRIVRAVEVLERLGTAEARQVLETLAQGAPGALTTRHAQAVLDRQARRR